MAQVNEFVFTTMKRNAEDKRMYQHKKGPSILYILENFKILAKVGNYLQIKIPGSFKIILFLYRIA